MVACGCCGHAAHKVETEEKVVYVCEDCFDIVQEDEKEDDNDESFKILDNLYC